MAKINTLSIVIPIVLIIVYTFLALGLRSLFPSSEAIIDQLAKIYGRFGYEIVIIGALVEALVLVNLFTPGIAAVGLGVVFSKMGQIDLTLTIICAVLGALSGFSINFWLGHFGFGHFLEKIGYGQALKKGQIKLEKSGLKTFILGFIHPNIGALVSLAAGILRMDFKKFFVLAFLSTLIWYIFWGLTIFALGQVFLVILSKYVFIIFIFVAAVWLLLGLYEATKKN